MRLLVDTHVLIWSATRPDTIPIKVADALVEADAIFASAVSVYEIDYKRQCRAALAAMPDDVGAILDIQDFEWLPITPGHARRAARLPLIHRDPWDRILVAQAQVEGLTLVTADEQIGRYDVAILW